MNLLLSLLRSNYKGMLIFYDFLKQYLDHLLIRSFRTNILHSVMELEKLGQKEASFFPQNYIPATKKVHNIFYKTV